MNLINNNLINGCANITGGGLSDNIKRIIPDKLSANISLDKIKTSKIFNWLKNNGISDKEMLKTFNCGVGFCLIIESKNLKKISKFFSKEYKPYVIGKILNGKNKVKLNGSINWLSIKLEQLYLFQGTGSNLKSLIKFSKTKKSPISINFIVSNNSKAKGLNYAKKFKIKKKVLNFKNKKLSENKLLSILKKNNIEMICLAGFMKILSKNFIKKFKGKILNIHPSLLPKYKGLNTHKEY